MQNAGGFVSAILLVLLACAPAHAEIVDRWAADVPMLDCDGIPCVDARLGSMPTGHLMIDIGDVVSIADDSDAAAIGFDPNARPMRASHTTAQIGTLTLADVRAAAVPLKDYVAKGESPHAEGSLAYSAFKDRVLQLDFVHKRVRISDVVTAARECGEACAPFSLITFGKKGPPIVVAEGFTVDGKPVTMQIDTVYTGSALIYDASIGKLGLQEQSETLSTEVFPFTDGGVTMKKACADEIAFAGRTLATNLPLYFPTPGVHQPDALFDGTIGLPLLRDGVVTLDFHNKTIRIAKT